MFRYFAFVGAAVLLAGCGQRESAREPVATTERDMSTPGASTPTRPDSSTAAATVQLQPTAGSRTYGALQVAGMPEAVRFSGRIQGLQPDSEFGFHVHETGDCSAPDASSAGDHFNPAGAAHGHPDTNARHAGDMHNIRSDAAGVANLDVTVTGVSLREGSSNTDVLGKAVVVHAQPDDYRSQPAGNSGERIACGVIALQSLTEAAAPRPSGGA
jgi:superoxide dismutase, Cu-Zn family